MHKPDVFIYIYIKRDTHPFREMYLKTYKAIKHTPIRTVVFPHACLQEGVVGQAIYRVGNSWGGECGGHKMGGKSTTATFLLEITT